MTPLSWFFTFFPALVLGATGLALIWSMAEPLSARWLAVPLALYGLPLLVHRLHARAFPLRPGISFLLGSEYSPWWGSHQIQWVFLAFPALERVLHVVPGLFSCWLRAWGSRVGRGVYWTPQVEVADRGLVVIGDHAVFGHRASLYGHLITPRDGDLMLLVRPVQVGAGAFIGAGSVLGPGVQVAPGATVPAGSQLPPGTRFPAPGAREV